MEGYLGLDGGGTACGWRFVEPDGELVALDQVTALQAVVLGTQEAAETARRVVDDACRAAGRAPDGIVIALAGVGEAKFRAEPSAALRALGLDLSCGSVTDPVVAAAAALGRALQASVPGEGPLGERVRDGDAA